MAERKPSATLAELDRLCEVATRKRSKVNPAKHLAARQKAEAKAPYNCPPIHHIQGAEAAREKFYAHLGISTVGKGRAGLLKAMDEWSGHHFGDALRTALMSNPHKYLRKDLCPDPELALGASFGREAPAWNKGSTPTGIVVGSYARGRGKTPVPTPYGAVTPQAFLAALGVDEDPTAPIVWIDVCDMEMPFGVDWPKLLDDFKELIAPALAVRRAFLQALVAALSLHSSTRVGVLTMGSTNSFKGAALFPNGVPDEQGAYVATYEISHFSIYSGVYGMDLTTRAERDAVQLTAFGSKHVRGATAVSPADLSMKDTPKARRRRYYISQAGGKAGGPATAKAGVLLAEALDKTNKLTADEKRAYEDADGVDKAFDLYAYLRGKGCAEAGVLLGRTLYDNEDLSPSARAAAVEAYAAGKPFDVYAFGRGQATAAKCQAEWGPEQAGHATLESVNALEQSKTWTKSTLKCSYFDGMRACLTVAKTIPGGFELCFDFRVQSGGSIYGVFPHVRLCHDGPWIKLAVADQMIGVASKKRFHPVGKKELERAGITDRSLNSWVEAALDFTPAETLITKRRASSSSPSSPSKRRRGATADARGATADARGATADARGATAGDPIVLE